MRRSWSAWKCLGFAVVGWLLHMPGVAQAQAQVLVPAGSEWTYLDTGSNPGSDWKAPAFDDSAWRVGLAQLGYGDGDEITVVRYGPDARNKFITTYFRRTFEVADPAAWSALTLRLIRDDGAVVHLNGQEVFRSNMPAGTTTASTLAIEALDHPEEAAWVVAGVSGAALVAGTNVLAVEIHQAWTESSDLSFDLELTAAASPPGGAIVRGPYVQMGTSSGMVLRWRTDRQTPSVVEYGLSPDALQGLAADSAPKTEHGVTLTGLQPDTKYYYAVGTGSERLAGGDQAHWFATSPPAGTAKPTRIWVLGDSGTADANAAAVRNGYQAWTGSARTDFWLMLGDNAYENGTDAEYTAAVFNTYPAMLRNSVLWPSLGNHDAASSTSATQSGPYFNAFTLPSQGEAGGAPSGTKAYYSFDYGSIHVVVLDSADSDRSPGGAMATWLRNDLAQNTLPWIIAIFHHAPYSRSTHNSDWALEMSQMRQNLVPILEQGGVDLVLAGHSHAYERSFLIDGHYQDSGLFSAANVRDGGNGREDGTGVYRKNVGVPHQGTVYAIVGCSGDPISEGSFDHPAMFTGFVTLGSLVIDVDGLRLDATFVDAQGGRRDYFTIMKDTAGPPDPDPDPEPQPDPEPAPAAPANLAAQAISSATIALTWADQSSNETGFEVERAVGAGGFAVVARLEPSTSSYTDTGLAAATTYSYRVRAVSAGAASVWSATAAAKTKARPAAPSALKAVANNRTSVTLSWSDNSDEETGFRIQRSTNGSTYTNVAEIAADQTGYTVTGLKANTTYYFRVRALREDRMSAFSNTAKLRTPR